MKPHTSTRLRESFRPIEDNQYAFAFAGKRGSYLSQHPHDRRSPDACMGCGYYKSEWRRLPKIRRGFRRAAYTVRGSCRVGRTRGNPGSLSSRCRHAGLPGDDVMASATHSPSQPKQTSPKQNEARRLRRAQIPIFKVTGSATDTTAPVPNVQR